MTNTHWLLASLLLAGLSAGPALAREDFTEELHQTYPLATDGRIHVDNINGAIRICVWDRPEVKLDAVKHARKKEDLELVKIEITTKPSSLKIHTEQHDAKSWFHWRGSNSASVDYTLTVPASARLDEVSDVNGSVEIDGVVGPVHASTVNGAIRAKGLAANADLSSVNGAVKATFTRMDAVKSVSATTVNGAVELDLPANANADLDVTTLNGGISGDVPVKKNWPVGKEVKTRLGEGGAKIHASTVNGGLRIHLLQLEQAERPLEPAK